MSFTNGNSLAPGLTCGELSGRVSIMVVSKEEVRDMVAFNLMLDLQRAVWDLKVRLKVVEGRLGIKGQSELPELPELPAPG